MTDTWAIARLKLTRFAEEFAAKTVERAFRDIRLKLTRFAEEFALVAANHADEFPRLKLTRFAEEFAAVFDLLYNQYLHNIVTRILIKKVLRPASLHHYSPLTY